LETLQICAYIMLIFLRSGLTGRKPLIGVTPAYDYDSGETSSKKGYCEAVNKAGGVAMLFSVSLDEDVLTEAFMRCDGLVVTGGPDINPQYYGEKNMPFNGKISPYKDYMDDFMIKKAFEYNKPVLGICRGIQSINVALGGTLYQDVHVQVNDREIIKHRQEAPYWYPIHKIEIIKDSIVWNSFKSDSIGVNSIHHQAIKDLAPSFVVTSRASDSIIESIEHIEHNFLVGVQWHPERMWEQSPVYLGIFEKFIEACKA